MRVRGIAEIGDEWIMCLQTAMWYILPTSDLALLGAVASIDDAPAHAAAREDRIAKLKGPISHSLELGFATPEDRKLRCKLGFRPSAPLGN